MSETTFRIHPSPVGEILIVATDAGIVSLQPLREPLGAALEPLAHVMRSVPQHDDRAGGDIDVQLDEYFAGERRRFDTRLDWRLTRGFSRAALEAVCDVPYGETASYGEIAIVAGSPGAARAVGTACATTPFSIVVPVHRVVRADGSLGRYGNHPEMKRFLVELERAALDDDGRETAGV